jgi:hypothetical protein
MSLNIQIQNYNDSVISTNELIAPIGDHFNQSGQTKYPYKGAIGYAEDSQLLYYGNGVEWLLAGSTGSTGLGSTGATGIAGTTGTTGVGFTGQSGSTGIPGQTGQTGQAGQYTATAPIAATDNNGIIVNNGGGTLGLEFADTTHNGIVSTTGQSYAGVKFFTNGIQLNTVQSASDGVVLSFYETSENQTLTQTWTGTCFSGPASDVWGYERIANRCFLDIAEVSQTAGGAGSLISSTVSLPAYMTPGVNRGFQMPVINNSVVVQGYAIVLPSGQIQIGVGFPSAGSTFSSANFFGTTGTNGFVAYQLFYFL